MTFNEVRRLWFNCYVIWRARILGSLKAIITCIFWVIVRFLSLCTTWNFMFEYFLNSLSLEIDIWLFQLQSYYPFLRCNLVFCCNFISNSSSTLALSCHHIKRYQLGSTNTDTGMSSTWRYGNFLKSRIWHGRDTYIN